MKITTELMQIIVNEKQVSNERLIEVLLNVANINNVSKDSLLSDVDSFIRKVLVSIRNTTIEIIETAKNDELLKVK